MLEGTFEFELEGERKTAAPGTFVHVPRGALHGFGNRTHSPAKLLDYHMPGGFENFFRESGTVRDDVRQGPPNAPVDFDKFVGICAKHGMEVPPPPAR